jgi:hypothetical protein
VLRGKNPYTFNYIIEKATTLNKLNLKRKGDNNNRKKKNACQKKNHKKKIKIKIKINKTKGLELARRTRNLGYEAGLML